MVGERAPPQPLMCRQLVWGVETRRATHPRATHPAPSSMGTRCSAAHSMEGVIQFNSCALVSSPTHMVLALALVADEHGAVVEGSLVKARVKAHHAAAGDGAGRGRLLLHYHLRGLLRGWASARVCA